MISFNFRLYSNERARFAAAAKTERALRQLKKLWKRKIFIIHWPLWLSGISCLFTWYKATKLIREPGKHSIIPMCQLSQPNYSSVHFTIENLFHYMLSESQKNKKIYWLGLKKAYLCQRLVTTL